MTFADEIVGFSGDDSDTPDLLAVSDFISMNRNCLSAYAAATSFRLFNKKATATSTGDIFDLPFPESGDLGLSASEAILVHDIVAYQRDLIRRGDQSVALKSSGQAVLPAFNETFLAAINHLYRDNPLVAHPSQSWPGIICQPYSFGAVEIDWSDSETLRGRVDALERFPFAPSQGGGVHAVLLG